MKLSQLKKMSSKDLAKHAQTLKKKLAEKRRAMVLSEETDNQQLAKTRRELARTKTLLVEAQNNQQSKEENAS